VFFIIHCIKNACYKVSRLNLLKLDYREARILKRRIISVAALNLRYRDKHNECSQESLCMSCAGGVGTVDSQQTTNLQGITLLNFAADGVLAKCMLGSN
jgi:hypothetical protein